MSWIRDPKPGLEDEKHAKKAEEQYRQSLVQEWDAPVKSTLNDAGKFIWGRRFPYIYHVKSETQYEHKGSKLISRQLWRVGKGRKLTYEIGYYENRQSPNIKVELKFNRTIHDQGTGLPVVKYNPCFEVSGHWGTDSGGYASTTTLSKDELQEALQKAIEFIVRKEESGGGW